ncbi:MAG: hypothetical protein ACM3IJ_02550 [Candidatus Levyibacteriota bacterium]
MPEKIGSRPEIKWATLVPEPKTGDPMSTELGVVRIGIGNVLYTAHFEGLQREIDQRAIPTAEGNNTRLYIGRADSPLPFLKVIFVPEQPITLTDADRINGSVGLATDLYRLETAWRAGMKIREISDKFILDTLRAVPKSDVDTFDAIAVAVDKLMQYANRDYPREFLKVADRMEELGVVSISPANMGENHLDFWDPRYIRKTFCNQQDNKESK